MRRETKAEKWTKKKVFARLLIHHLPRSFRLLAHQNNQRQLGELITSRSVRTHRPRRSPGRDVKLRDAPRDGMAASRRCTLKMHHLMHL